MDCWINQGSVARILRSSGTKQELEVVIGNKHEQAINFPALTGKCAIGDHVILNTTGVFKAGIRRLSFCNGNRRKTQTPQNKPGHIIKLRYTPSQGRVLSVEEPDSPYHEILAGQSSIKECPFW